MLYLALPPIPTAIVSTLTPESSIENSDCESLQVKSKKSELVNKLLGKILADSVSTKPCATKNKNSAITQKNTQQSKQLKDFASVAPLPTPEKPSSTATNSLGDNDRAAVDKTISPDVIEKARVQKQS